MAHEKSGVPWGMWESPDGANAGWRLAVEWGE